jgi:CheY-like chemotaxis protein
MKNLGRKTIFLADDDLDDRLLFQDALKEINDDVTLTIADDGIQLMDKLNKTVPPPDVIFLDLNMPRKNGFECLEEIKRTKKFKHIPVVIFSTSAQQETVNKTYEQGATYYVSKPGSFAKLKKAILEILGMEWGKINFQPPKENFLLIF